MVEEEDKEERSLRVASWIMHKSCADHAQLIQNYTCIHAHWTLDYHAKSDLPMYKKTQMV